MYKDKLLGIIKKGKVQITNDIIKLIYLSENEITILFDKKTFNLKGWKIVDQYSNNINFSLNIVSQNEVYKKETFKVPAIN